MTDLRARFRPAKEVDAPDDWPRVVERGRDARIDADLERAGRGRRVGAAVVAVATMVAAAIFLWNAFGGTSPAPPASSSSPPPSEVAPVSRDDVAFLPPTFFRTMDGWHYHDSGQGTPGGSAWAANVPFDPADLSPTSPAIPPETIAALRPGDVVLTALAVSSLHQAEDGPWPPGSLAPLELADAIVRGPDAEEPPGDYAVYELQGYALIRVYFGEPHPSPDEVAAAQWQLDGLEVPPTCPVPAKGSFPDTMQLSEDTVAPGSDIVVTGLMPFQREDGSYDREASSVIELWWDGDPATWEQLFADPASTGATLVGSGGQGSCFLDATITIPADAAPGDHTIVGLNTDAQHTGAALYGSVVVHLVGP